MLIAASRNPAVLALTDAGLIPPNCRSWSLHLDANSVVTVKMEVFVTQEEMDKIADVLVANPSTILDAAMLVIFKDRATRRDPIEVNLPSTGQGS